MNKLEKLEIKLNLEIRKSEITEKRSNIWYKIIFIFLIGYVSANINNFNNKVQDIKDSINFSRMYIKEQIDIAREQTVNGSTKEIREANFKVQKELINEHFKQEEFIAKQKEKIVLIREDFFITIFLGLIPLILPLIFFHFKLEYINKNIHTIEKKIKKKLSGKV